ADRPVTRGRALGRLDAHALHRDRLVARGCARERNLHPRPALAAARAAALDREVVDDPGSVRGPRVASDHEGACRLPLAELALALAQTVLVAPAGPVDGKALVALQVAERPRLGLGLVLLGDPLRIVREGMSPVLRHPGVDVAGERGPGEADHQAGPQDDSPDVHRSL